MTRAVRRRYRFEVAVAAAALIAAIVTAVSPEWIEATFGVDPDGGSGALETAIVIVLALTAVVSAWLARRERRRAAVST